MSTVIHIYGPTSMLKGPFPLEEVRLATSYPVEGAQFSQAYKKGLWDGRKHLFSTKTGAFPTGLVNVVKQACEAAGVAVSIEDHRVVPTPKGGDFSLIGATFAYPYDFQLDTCKKVIEDKQGIVKIATGGGKCLAPDTLVLMFDGTRKAAKDVLVGDFLMGPDSYPRRVLSTAMGKGPMFRVTPNKGVPWECNDVHVLTLKHTVTGNIVDIPLKEYLLKNRTFKHTHKLFTVGVEFLPQLDPLPIDPYFLGVWCGDGTKNTKINKKKGMRNLLGAKIRDVMKDMKRLPRAYLISSRESRLQFLAGLLDTDGHLSKGRFFEITQVRHNWAEDILFLARSLGFSSQYMADKVVKGVVYKRVIIKGDIEKIPTRIYRKTLIEKQGVYDSLKTGFSVTALGEGIYCGFTLDGDGRFLLGDFTVTHNTIVACALTKYLGLKTLFLVTTRELLYQGQKQFMQKLGVTEVEVGLIGDGHWSPGSWVTIATVDTLEARINTDYCQKFLKEVEVLFIDEAHHTGSDTFWTVCTLCPAFWRVALSATPLDRSDGANLRLIAATGDIIVDIRNKFLVDRGITAKASIIFDKVTEPVLKGKGRKKITYQIAYKQGVVENEQMLGKIVDWTKVFREAGLSVLILVEEIAHGKRIDDALWTQTGGVFIPHQFINGTEDTEVRQNALNDFGNRTLPVMVSSAILDEGVDCYSIDALILAGSRKSRIKTMQRLGRGLRGKNLIVLEFANFTNDYLLKHSLQRMMDYKAEECFEIHQTGPDLALVKKLWNGGKSLA